jgi:hypothetical protein
MVNWRSQYHPISSKGGSLMQGYTRQHKFYCGIDLHARKMYICILDEKEEVREHRQDVK